MDNIEMIGGLKCDSCDWEDMTIPMSDYEKYINTPCPKCGENILTEEDFNTSMALFKAMGIVNQLSPEELGEINNNLTEEQINAGLDLFNDLGLHSKGKDKDGNEIWSTK